ncbi:MAG: gluconokinase [Rhizobiaceae bacterium]
MGVAGCGKTTIGEALANAISGKFLDGDAYHPPRNIEKMSSGVPLTDEDRWPWLATFGQEISKRKGYVVGGCSALKRVYREHITRAAGEPVLFVYLDGSRELIAGRMGKREGHFMPTSLLDSQFETLEVPSRDENAIHVDIDTSTEEIVSRILKNLTDQTGFIRPSRLVR